MVEEILSFDLRHHPEPFHVHGMGNGQLMHAAEPWTMTPGTVVGRRLHVSRMLPRHAAQPQALSEALQGHLLEVLGCAARPSAVQNCEPLSFGMNEHTPRSSATLGSSEGC